MQDYTVLPQIGIDPGRFWRQVDAESRARGGERMLVYMRLLLERSAAAGIPLKRADFSRMAGKIRLYPGVIQWFDHIGRYVKRDHMIALRHYIVSAGLSEILQGCKIARHFARIYASEYHFDEDEVAIFPKYVITDTTKTQYLFRINKGREDPRESINEHMPEQERPVPFSRIIYIGDGTSDVPSMAVARKNGGHAIAVFDSKRRGSVKTCAELLQAGRVDFIAPADYRVNSALTRRVRLLLDSVMGDIAYQRELVRTRAQHGIRD